MRRQYRLVVDGDKPCDYKCEDKLEDVMAVPRGRPPAGEFKGKSTVFTTRIRPDLRERLAESAEQNGRSLSQEVERRLSDSFRLDDRMEDAFGSADNFWTMRIIAMALENSHSIHGSSKSWRQDPQAFDSAMKVVVKTLEALRPGPVPEKTSKLTVVDDFWESLVSVNLWDDIAGANLDLGVNEGSRSEHILSAMKRKLGRTAETALQRARSEMPSNEEWRRRSEEADKDDKMSDGGQTSKKGRPR
jgi:hypothetical protein